MKLENAGTWRMDNIMKKFGVDRETARRLKFGEDVDITEFTPTSDTMSTDAAESGDEE